MYSNYLVDVAKLVYIIGEIETTSNFKRLIDSSNEYRNKCFFKCVDELPVNAYRKIKIQCRRRGILRRDWLHKILDRSPLMIFMIFNCSQPLEQNEKWEDRLSIIIRKINKVYDILKSSNKEDVVFRIIIIVSKESSIIQGQGQTTNIMDKITTFLKNYERELQIFQTEYLSKEITKHKSFWFGLIEKVYERKFRSISKRMQESYIERRLSCSIKLAIMSQIMQKKQCFNQYQQAYRSIHYRFMETASSSDILNFDLVQELRSLADVLLLRMIVVKVNISTTYSMIERMITEHLSFFSQKQESKASLFFKYKDLLWKENFLQNLLQVLCVNDIVQTIPHEQFAQLVNAVVTYAHELSIAHLKLQPFITQQQVKGRLIPVQESYYVGSTNYAMGLQITNADVIATEMGDLLDKRKDFITRGMQVITRYKSMKIFKKHEINFLDIYLIKFFLLDDKFQSISEIYNSVIKSALQHRNIYILNELLKELNDKIKEIDSQDNYQVLQFFSMLVLVCDYFQNQEQLCRYTQSMMQVLGKPTYKTENIDLLSEQIEPVSKDIVKPTKMPITIPFQAPSLLMKFQMEILNNFHPIQEQLNIKILMNFNKFFINPNLYYEVDVIFNCPEIKKFYNIQIQPETSKELNLSMNLLHWLQKDTKIYIENFVVRVIGQHQLCFVVKNLHYSKYNYVNVYTRLKPPEINIKFPYEVCYINETIKFLIQFQDYDDKVQLETKFTVKEDEALNKTEVFINYEEKMNLVNSKCYQAINLQEKNYNQFYLKCNKVGPKILKFIFNLSVSQKLDDKELKSNHTIVKDVSLKVNNLFRAIKILKQSITGFEIFPTQVPINQKVILIYSFRTTEMVNIIELGSNKNPENYIKTIKEMPTITDVILTPEQKLRSTYIFQAKEDVIEEAKNEKIFLMSFYAKWNRIDMDLRLGLIEKEPIENIYIDDSLKIGIRQNKVEVEFEEGKILQKMKKDHLTIRYKNLTNESGLIMSIMENSDAILRIGSRTINVKVDAKKQVKIEFQIIGVKAGYTKYPKIRTFFNGTEIKDSAGNDTICII